MGRAGELTNLRVIDVAADLEGLADRWDELAAAIDFPNIFASWGFSWAWWRAYGDACNLRVVVVEDVFGRVRLIAPFYSPRSSPEVLQVLGYSRADYNSLLSSRGDTEALTQLFHWLTRQRDWRVVILRRVPADAAIVTLLPSTYDPAAGVRQAAKACLTRSSPFAVRRWRHEHPRIDRDGLKALSGLLDEYNYSRQVKRLQARGRLEYDSIRDPEEIRRLLPGLMDLHVSQFSNQGETSLFVDPNARRFYHYLTEELGPSGALRFDVLRLDGTMLAAHFGFSQGGRVYFYKPAHNFEFSSYRPGKLLLAYIIQDCYARGARELDLLFGNEPFKDRYASDVRTTASMHVWRSRFHAARRAVRLRMTSRARPALDPLRGAP